MANIQTRPLSNMRFESRSKHETGWKFYNVPYKPVIYVKHKM